jgi:hypothetical protein
MGACEWSAERFGAGRRIPPRDQFVTGIRGAVPAIAAALLMASFRIAAAPAEHPGERIYREGVLPNGSPLQARVSGDVRLRGPQAACELCHRRSGYGLGDSEVMAPPVAGEILFNDRDPPRSELLRSLFQDVRGPSGWAAERTPKVRPGYTDATLLRALRDGLDPVGRPLARAMPRYDLDTAAAAALIGYLHTLGHAPAPGVGPDAIRFATVVAGAVDPARQRAMLDVMEAFIAEHNLETARELARPGYSLNYKGEFRSARRAWTLDVWRVTGDPATWAEQLGGLYASRPVFAALGGLAEGDWRPIHDFCERQQMPCLFPGTDLPVVDPPSDDTLYVSTGLPGEAAAVADWLIGQHQAGRVLQIFRRGEVGERLAETFAATMASRGTGLAYSMPLGAGDSLSEADWQSLLRDHHPTAVAAWLGAADPAWRTLAGAEGPMVYASGGLLGDQPPPFDRRLPEGLRMAYRHAMPEDVLPQIYRIRAWLESRHVRDGDETLQLDTYFALSVAEHALIHMVDHFSREYLIEWVEHDTEDTLNPGTYPHLGLGPHQRFASKGDYIVELAEDGGLRRISPRIIPFGLEQPVRPIP